MNSQEQILANFQTRVRQMILSFKQLKKENDELYAMVEKSEKENMELRAKLEEKTKEYETLKAIRVIGVSDDDISITKDRLSRLIRDINKCIAVLTDAKAE